MSNFSTILQTDTVRSLVQDNALERSFHDALFPNMLFRSEVHAEPWPADVGDTQIFTAKGLMSVDTRPVQPGQELNPKSYSAEQWQATIQLYGDTIDSHLPSSVLAAASLFVSNTHSLGLNAAQTLNRIVRNRLYGAALSGHTVTDGVQSSVTLRVKRLNGFTRARNPALAGASKVRFDVVSTANPLSVTILDSGSGAVTRNVVGFTADTAGDEVGPGTLTLSASVSVADRAYVHASDKTALVRVGGGTSVGDLTATTDIPTLASVRAALARLKQDNVPRHTDGLYYAHVGPTSESLVYNDTEFQRLMTSLPEHHIYQEFALGRLLGCMFLPNNECPIPETVNGGTTASWDASDPFPGELFHNGNSSTGARVHRMLFSGAGGLIEYYQDLQRMITEGGLQVRMSDANVTNDSIEVFSERIKILIREPQDRMQDTVASTWKFVGDWPYRTDAATGSAARYKRCVVVEHTE